MKTFLQILFFFLLTVRVGFSQIEQSYGRNNILSFVYEDFEGDIFPPSGWNLEYTGTLYWQHSNQASGYGIGTSSAVFNNYWAAVGTTQSLVLTSLGPTSAGDSLSFDHAYATYSSEVDHLIIETSSDGGATYSTLVTLNGGASGQLVTAPPTIYSFIPSPTQWATKKYALPMGTNTVRFKAISAYGNNLYIDNCSIGSQFSIDVGVQSIDITNPTFSLPQIPKASVKNHGTTTQSFSVTMQITPGGYTSTKAVTSLSPNNVLQILFDEWATSVGTYSIKTFTTLPGDMDNSNDTLQVTTEVIQPQIANINAVFMNGQVFVTWDNLLETNVVYTLYKSPIPIQYGFQFASAQNLGNVQDNSGLNRRLTEIISTTTYLKIDSASAPLASNKGLFVATSTEEGSFYYAVTASFDDLEDTIIVVGGNSLSSPISESVMMPRPVWQQNRTLSGKIFEIYVLYATKVTSSIFPQMNNAGTFPYNFAVIKKGSVTPHPLTIYMHYGGSNFLNPSLKILDHPEEWVVSIDEWIPSILDFTLGYGYHENYDLFSPLNTIPTSGILYNYAAKKREYIINWALRNLPVDSTRVYLTGFSLGAHCAIFDAIFLREKIAAMFIYDPCFDMASFFDGAFDILWGSYQTNLLTNEGYTRNERLNAKYLMSVNKQNSLPVIFTFSGKQSEAWPEKPSVYDTIQTAKHGGYHFWSPRDHWGTFANSPWVPTFPNFSFFTRYRTNLSYPAFSNCSIDNDPGNGSPSNGDALGSINGHLDWKDDIVDEPGRWEITLFVKDLLTTSGTLTAQDSATTDVTLRRLQNFVVPSDSTIWWKNTRNGMVVQQGSFVYTGGLITLGGVQVFKDSSRIVVSSTPVSVEEQAPIPVEYLLYQNYPNPFNPSTTVKYSIPKASKVKLTLFNLLGEEVTTLVNEQKPVGTYELNWSAVNLPSGVYFYRLQAGDFVQTRKMILLK